MRIAPVMVWVAILAPTAARAQHFQKSGPELQVNTYTTYDQARPVAAVDPDGRVLVVWQGSANHDGHNSGVFGRRYGSGGAPLGAEFQINTYTTDNQAFPAVAAVGPDAFVVVWASGGSSFTQDGNGFGVYAQRYQAGAPVGAEFRVNSFTSGDQFLPSVAADSAGNFVVVWNDLRSEPNAGSFGIAGQRYASDGTPLGARFSVNTYTTGGQLDPKVASDAAGNFVVVWKNGGAGYAIQGQRYASTGAPLGTEFPVSETVSVDTEKLAAAAGANGFVVTWVKAGIPRSIGARRFATDGAPLGGEFRVDSSPASTSDPSVVLDPAGDFFVAWSGELDESGSGIFARRFSSAGDVLSEVRVNTYTNGEQLYPTLAESAGGRFVIVWQSAGQDGAGTGIFAQRLCRAFAGDGDDDGSLAVADVFFLINFLFAGGPNPPHSCDVDANGTTDVQDVFYLINYLFAGGPGPACA